jgi:thymidylate synthase
MLAAAASGGWDTMQYAILTHMLAQVCGYEVGDLVHIINNLHIYDRHIEAVKEVMNNPEYPSPALKINPDVKDFYDFKEEDFELVNYQSTKLSTKFEVAE